MLCLLFFCLTLIFIFWNVFCMTCWLYSVDNLTGNLGICVPNIVYRCSGWLKGICFSWIYFMPIIFQEMPWDAIPPLEREALESSATVQLWRSGHNQLSVKVFSRKLVPHKRWYLSLALTSLTIAKCVLFCSLFVEGSSPLHGFPAQS